MKRQREKESCKNSECSGAQMKRYCRQPAHKSLMKFRAFFKWKDSHKNHGVCFVCVHVCERFVHGKPPHVQDHIYKCAHRIKTIETIVHIKCTGFFYFELGKAKVCHPVWPIATASSWEVGIWFILFQGVCMWMYFFCFHDIFITNTCYFQNKTYLM